MDRCNSSAAAATLSSIILFIGSAVICILLRRRDNGNDNSDSLFPRNFSWGGRPAPESDEAYKAWLLSARQVDKFSNSVLNYVPTQFSFAKEQQQLDDDDGVDETTT